MQSFTIAQLPKIEFGRGKIRLLTDFMAAYGKHFLLVRGKSSLQQSPYWPRLQDDFKANGFQVDEITVAGEPSPQFVDEAASAFRGQSVDAVVAIGGGSVLDAGKAICGLVSQPHSVMEYLEGVGPERPYEGPALPYLAVPTTAGTGSEATKNAVLSVSGPEGFKKSFRSELLVPRLALLDPAMLETCPPGQIAANGMDALTQLMESYVSTKANPFTDALALSGIKMAVKALPAWYENGVDAPDAMDMMAYAALLSGICLAQTGLGSVHGLASPLGAFFPIPHGVVCGTLVAEATKLNIEVMQQRDADNPSLRKYAELSGLFSPKNSMVDPFGGMLEVLYQWTRDMDLPPLSRYGITEADFDRIVANARGSSMKTNPIVLTDDELKGLLKARLDNLW